MKKLFATSLACILIVTLAKAQGIGRSAFLADSLNQYINKALTYWRIPGAAICIVKDGKVVLMRGYGIRELGLNDRVTNNTLFMIGDNTRPFTGMALALLQENKKLTLDDKITRFLPDLKTANNATPQATIRDLLTEQVGFAANAGNFTFYNTNLSADQLLLKVPLLSAPYPLHKQWADANVNYAIAGEIIPWASGKTWDAYIKEHIFDPLEMNSALALSRDMPISPNKAVPHTIVDGRLTAIPYARLESMYAAGGICASVNDLSKWVMALLDDGKLNGKQVLPKAAIQATFQPQIVCTGPRMPDGSFCVQRYGLGWTMVDYHNEKMIYSDGRINGYQCGITLIPEQRLGIIVLTNNDKNQLPEALRYVLQDVYQNKSFVDYNEEFLREYKDRETRKQQLEKRYRDSVAYNLQPTMMIDSYLGRYHNNLYGDVFVTRGEGYDLEMRFEHHPKMFARLQPLGVNRFYATFSDPLYGKAVFPFTFQGGRITGVTVRVDADVEWVPYYFSTVKPINPVNKTQADRL